jgi:Response regulators consisting of a CheY-like receiver domain and a winged-helix DNA-binding domain
MNEKILIVDDTADIRELLLEALQMAGYVVCEAANGTEALRKIKTESPDLVILDIAMPDISGFQVLREMRKTSKTPVIMLSAMAETTDKVESLQLGADDYMTKPFQIAEMTARIEAVLRRTTMSNSVPEKIDFNDGRLLIDLAKRHVTLEDKELELTPKEYELLRELVLNAGIVLQYDYILKKIWGDEYKDEKQLVYAVAKRLRAKLEVNPKNPKYIIAISGVGYRFKEIP